ncbi:MAG: ATP-binding cassette domain-containing protein [Christensenella sp.]|nr:ATP-binding cassette domain-containing protein [Christensenella sp.]
MGWFDEQIKQRIKNDDEQFEAAFAKMANIVMDADELILKDEEAASDDAMKQILTYFRVRPREIPDDITGSVERLEYMLRPAGIMWRSVRLKPGWSRNAVGPMLVQNKEGGLEALIPRESGGYWHINGKRHKITSKMEHELSDRALCFYRPLPSKELKLKDLMKFVASSMSRGDLLRIIAATLCVALVGLLAPYANKILFNIVVPSGSVQLILPIAILLVGVSVSTLLITIFKTLLLSRMKDKLRLSIMAAAMMRLLNLSLAFFKQYSAGELLSRMKKVNSACQLLLETAFTTGLTALFSLIYIVQIFNFTPQLALPALLIIIISAGFSVISVFAMTPWQKKTLALWAKFDGITYALISGVQKLKLTGSERRAFAKWANIYSDAAKMEYRPPWFIRAGKTISYAIILLGALALYYFAGSAKVSVADYMAFTASYALVSGAFAALAEVLRNIAKIGPTLEMAKPILAEQPETAEEKRMLTRLMGGIELNNVSFRYSEDSPYILNNLTLKIKSGQYLAVVGKTGCGKSTFIRMLLGFEIPERGAVYFDGQDIATVDLKSLRQKIGTVTQSGKLFEGTIFSNIAVCAPHLTEEEAWQAAEMSGLAEDIRNMPMGMQTLISEGGGGLSGGQRQRLMIARAIAPKPRVLIFDEATSALDNITQKQVSDALDSLKCTRIVVAHRLSTIRQCDRIVVLDSGKIIEDGSFEELIDKKGFFAELVSRQMA